MIIFELQPGESTSRDIVLDDVCARFRKAQYLVRARTNAAIDSAMATGTLIETDGRLRTGVGLTAWMLNVEIPVDDEPPPGGVGATGSCLSNGSIRRTPPR